MATAKGALEERQVSTVDYEDSVNVDIESVNKPSTSTSLPQGKGEPLPSKKEFTAKSCQIEGVTVFLDRAEVKRIIEVVLDAGENEVLLTGLPFVTDQDSVRYCIFHHNEVG